MSHLSLVPLLLLSTAVLPASTPKVGALALETNRIFAELVELRHDLHRHPEASGQEVRTARIVAKHLRAAGLEVRTGVGGHGVVGVLRGAQPGPVVAYRADMDAAPGTLKDEATLASTVPGLSHGCGHDVHTAIGVGVARVLATQRKALKGTVLFLFQPSEENGLGARRMIADGALKPVQPSAIFGLHIAPTSVGTLTSTPGTGLPGVEARTFTFQGPTAEEAAQAVAQWLRKANTVTLQAFPEIMKGLEQEDCPLLRDFVTTGAHVRHTQESFEVSTMIRCAREATRTRLEADLQATLEVWRAKGTRIDVKPTLSLPALKGDPTLGVWALEPLAKALGKDAVKRAHHAFPFNSEDFACFLEEAPGVLFWLGGSNPSKGLVAAPHAPMFAVDEEAIRTGVLGMSHLLTEYLATKTPGVKGPR